jgi:hypothetical protein
VVGTRAAVGERRTPQGSIPNELTKGLYLAGSDQGLLRLEQLLAPEQRPENAAAWADVRKFSGMRLPEADEIVHTPEGEAPDKVLTWEAVLHQPAWGTQDSRRRDLDEMLVKWTELIRRLAGSDAIRLGSRREIDDVIFVPVRLPIALAREAAKFNPLRSLRPMPELRLFGSLQPLLPFPAPPVPAAEPQTAVRIAVFDGGVDPECEYVGRFTRLRTFSDEPAQRVELEHGHAVTGMILYGYHEPCETLPAPIARVDHYKVLPLTNDDNDPWNLDLLRVLDHIVDVVSSTRYHLINLSLGPRLPVRDDDAPHVWTAELDRLSRVHNVLFVAAAGNNGEEAVDLGGNRVQPPGDGINVLAVGACAQRRARRYARSPISAVGPGRHGARIRPVGVAFGGGGAEAYYVMRPHGSYGQDHGTSYAAPLVTHSLAGLIGTIGEDRCDPATLRAFAVHHARRSTRNHVLHELGYGRIPEDLTTVLDCAPDSVTLTFRDEIQRDEVHAQRLPLPRGLPAEQSVQVRLTLCYTGATDAGDAVDYTSAGLELRFRPHRRLHAFRDRDTKERIGIYDLELDAERIAAFDEASIQKSPRPMAGKITRISKSEQQRRTAGKWETTIIGRIPSIPAGELFEPYIEISYFARRRGELLKAKFAEPLPYTMLMTVTTPGFSLYDRVRAEFAQYAPISVVPEIQL